MNNLGELLQRRELIIKSLMDICQEIEEEYRKAKQITYRDSYEEQTCP